MDIIFVNIIPFLLISVNIIAKPVVELTQCHVNMAEVAIS